MKIKLYGTRGSAPAAYKDFLEYGGNTCSVYVDCGMNIIFDAGSGILPLGKELINDKRPIHIFLSHVHLDHISGLSGFSPLYQKGREIHIYGEMRDSRSIEDQIRNIISPPYWPVGFDDFAANISFHTIAADEKIELNSNVSISTQRSIHPNQCLLFRVCTPDSDMVYALDYEYVLSDHDTFINFIKNADLMIFDAAYLPGKEIPGFGHSSWKTAVDVANEAYVNEVVMAHYSYEYNDTVLSEEEKKMMEYSDKGLFGREGMEIEI